MNDFIKICITLLLLILSPVYATAQPTWEFQADMPTPRSGICAAVLDGKIYVIGGRDSSDNILNIVERYNPVTQSWETNVPSLLISRHVNAAAAVLNDTLFVIGGRDETGAISARVEYFVVADNRWRVYPGLQQKREGLTAISLSNRIYALGGLGENDGNELLLNTVEFYDRALGQWQVATDWQLEQGLASFATVTVADSAFSMGGFSDFGPVNFVQRYYPGLDTQQRTEQRAEMPTARGNLAATVRSDSILVIGGRNALNRVVEDVDVFLTQYGYWDFMEPINIARENHVVITLNRITYVIGGLDASGKTLASVETKSYFGGPTTGAAESDLLPKALSLAQNYPNPFNAGTVIRFSLPQNNLEPANLSIYNLKGQLIKALVRNVCQPGEHEVTWDASDDRGLTVASGVYIYILQHSKTRLMKKMLLIQ